MLFKHFVKLRRHFQRGIFKAFGFFFAKALFLKKFCIAFIADKPDFMPKGRKAHIRVVLPQNQAVFASACHHAVRVKNPFCDKVVHKGTDI